MWVEKEWYNGVVPVQVDDDYFDGPKGYHEILTVTFGDYMTPPPPDKRVPMHLLPEEDK